MKTNLKTHSMDQTRAKPRILLVDDDAIFLGSTRRYLQRAGYEVLIARDGNEAIEFASASRVGVVVTDILMPHKDGLEIIREIHKRWPAVKIIAMSGGGFLDGEILLDLGLKFGASGALEKPFPREQLLAVLEQLDCDE